MAISSRQPGEEEVYCCWNYEFIQTIIQTSRLLWFRWDEMRLGQATGRVQSKKKNSFLQKDEIQHTKWRKITIHCSPESLTSLTPAIHCSIMTNPPCPLPCRIFSEEVSVSTVKSVSQAGRVHRNCWKRNIEPACPYRVALIANFVLICSSIFPLFTQFKVSTEDWTSGMKKCLL